MANEAGVFPDAGAVQDAEPMANEAGVFPDAGGGEQDAGLQPEWSFPWVLITDTSFDENMNGTPGVDICSVQSTCGLPIGAQLNPGQGEICETEGPDCSTNRADPNAALSFEFECDPFSVPSHFVSLGVGGELTLVFDRDQQGCTLTVVEHEGADLEEYVVQVCDNAFAEACLTGNDGSTFLGLGSGTIVVDVPWAD